MRRGDVITVAMAGDYGKPRPAVIIQADQLTESGGDSVLICSLTSEVRDVGIRRVSVLPDRANGLRKPSQVMAEKIFAIKKEKCGAVIGRLDPATMAALDDALMFVTGLMDRR